MSGKAQSVGRSESQKTCLVNRDDFFVVGFNLNILNFPQILQGKQVHLLRGVYMLSMYVK